MSAPFIIFLPVKVADESALKGLVIGAAYGQADASTQRKLHPADFFYE